MKTNTTSAISRKTATLFAFVVTMLLLIWLVWPEHRRSAPPRLESASLATAVISSEAIVPLPDSLPDLDQRKIALGNLLFHDPSLSQDNTIACASCHILQQGGVDGKKLSIGIKGRLSLVNAPTVYNSGFNFRQFWDGRAEGLEEQVAGPIHNPQEMGSNWPEVITKLRKNSAYETTFKKIYGNGITSDNIADAIATFVRSLITPNARFDKYLKGDSKAITPYELSGYELFTSYGCIACHQGRNVGGNMYEKLGVMRDYFAERGDITIADQGRYAITHNPDDLHKFKVPSLRNIALTAPYFHDGSAQALGQAVATMGKYQLGILIPGDDIARIVAFLRTLTGEYNGKPL